MATMADGSPVAHFARRFEDLKKSTDTSNSLIQDLISYAQHIESTYLDEINRLNTELKHAGFDLVHATDARRRLQQKGETDEALIQQLTRDNEKMKNRNPYVAVLLDGDGILFQNSYIQKGLEGGKQAAAALRASIAKICGNLADEVEVVAKVCANVSGLTNALRREGGIDNPAQVRDFTIGFTQSKATFDFIDVGSGKERADSKIKEDTRWHLKNVNCKMVVLGISHDRGYAPFLDEIRSGTETRIRILEGSPTERDLAATNVEIIKLDEPLFRSDKLILPVVEYGNANTANGTYGNYGANGTNGTKGPNGVSGANGTKSPAPTSSLNGKIPVLSGPPLAAVVARKATPPPVVKLPAQTEKQLKTYKATQVQKRPVAWNPGPRGLDPVINFNAHMDAVMSIKNRKQGEKLCNFYVLTGHCDKVHCEFRHTKKVTPEEKIALSYLARLSPCGYGQECDDPTCVYGHNCPSAREGVCTNTHCKFREDQHPPSRQSR